MKINKETAREKFRSTVAIKDVQAITNLDPDYEYKKVCATFKEGLGRVDRYIDAGWEVVYSNETPKDDRTIAANQAGKDDSVHQKPVTTTSKGGDSYILMRCHKDQREKNEKIKHEAREVKFRSQQKLKKQGKDLKITGTDISFDS